jgi:hypothetical protein
MGAIDVAVDFVGAHRHNLGAYGASALLMRLDRMDRDRRFVHRPILSQSCTALACSTSVHAYVSAQSDITAGASLDCDLTD